MAEYLTTWCPFCHKAAHPLLLGGKARQNPKAGFDYGYPTQGKSTASHPSKN
jgi:hypothetical protein